MSAILNDYCEQHHSSAVCIVLRGLYALCESEVKCMSSTGITDYTFFWSDFLVLPHCNSILSYLKLRVIEEIYCCTCCLKKIDKVR